MNVGAPVNVTSTNPINVSIPGASGAGGVSGIKLSNASAYFVQVNILGSNFYLDPQTTTTIPLGGQSSQYQLSLVGGQLQGASSVIYPTYFYASDPPLQFGSSPINQQVSTVSGQVTTDSTDVDLYNQSVTLPNTDTGSTTTFTIPTSSTPASHGLLVEVDVVALSGWASSGLSYIYGQIFVGSTALGTPYYQSIPVVPIDNPGTLIRVMTQVVPASFLDQNVTIALIASTSGGPGTLTCQIRITGYTATIPPNSPRDKSFQLGLSVPDMLAPADFVLSGNPVNFGAVGTTIGITYAPFKNFILKRINFAFSDPTATGNLVLISNNLGNIGYISPNGTYNQLIDAYISAADYLSVYNGSSASQTGNFSLLGVTLS